MRITTGMLLPFAGGQIEVQNGNEDYLFRGEVATAEVDGTKVRVRLAWLAKNDGTPSRPSMEWTVEKGREVYEASLEIYSVSDIGEGRLCLNSVIIGETVILFPKGYTNADGEESKLERTRIKGLPPESPESDATSTQSRIAKLREILASTTNGRALGQFLDTLNSLEDFEELAPIVLNWGDWRAEFVPYYRENLRKWGDPKLPDGFQARYPLLARRLDTPQKIRIFLRAADFRQVTPELMGEVMEEILHRHEVLGEQCITYSHYRGDKRCDALRIVYHTQQPAGALHDLVLPGTTCGISSVCGLFIDWRTEAERKAAGVEY